MFVSECVWLQSGSTNKEMALVTTTIHPSEGYHITSTSHIVLPEFSDAAKDCHLYLHFKLPSLVFVDPHELSDRRTSYTYTHWGNRDLEKPIFAFPDEQSNLLIDVDLKSHGFEANSMEVEVAVPMHLRYGDPTNSLDGFQTTRLDWPDTFLRCPVQCTFLRLFFFAFS